MNLKSALLALSVFTVSANLYSELPSRLAPLAKAIKNGDYYKCKNILDKIVLTPENKEQLAEMANQAYQDRAIAYANRSHGLYRFIKFLFCGEMTAGSASFAAAVGGSGAVAGTIKYYVPAKVLGDVETIAAPIAIVSMLFALWNLHGMYDAVYSSQNLAKSHEFSTAIKNAVESKKVNRE